MKNEYLLSKKFRILLHVYKIWENGQIENEYGPVEWEIGAPGKAYTKWAAQMAEGLSTGVPWIMCKQDEDVPDSIVCFLLYFFFQFSPFNYYASVFFLSIWLYIL